MLLLNAYAVRLSLLQRKLGRHGKGAANGRPFLNAE